MLRNKLFVLLGVLVLASMLLSACKPTATPEPTATTTPTETKTPEPTPPPAPKTLVICQGQEPDTLYRYGGSMLAASHILHAVYDGPVDSRTYSYQPVLIEQLPTFDNGGAVLQKVTVQTGDKVLTVDDEVVELDPAAGHKIKPSGCRSADCAITFDGTPVEMDQLVATFKFKEGVKWSDGEPLTADDSVYAFELAADPDTPIAKYGVERTASYVATDDRTVVWTAVPGYMDATYFVNVYEPKPRHLWQEQLGYTAKDLLEAPESSRTPLGWGAFVIEEWVQGDHITVQKNPLYYRASEGLPYVDTIIFRFVSDSNATVAQLISGECDIATQDTSLEDQAELLLKLEEQGVLKPVFQTGTVWEHVDFGINPVETYERPDFFEDVRVRKAIAHCLNRQAVIDTILYGRSIAISSYVPPEHPLYAEDVVSYEYDPEKGKALLEEVGWKDVDGDGIREAQGVAGIPDGTKLEFKWQSTTASMRVQYMQLFQQDLAACGIKLNLENLSSREYFADGPDGPLFGRHFDMGSFAWLTGVEPACNLYVSWEIPTEENAWGGQNDTGWSDPAFDAACRKALQALPGTADYIEGHKEAQRIFSENLPVIPLFLRIKLAAYRPEVKGFIMDPTENSEMWNIEAFDIQQ